MDRVLNDRLLNLHNNRLIRGSVYWMATMALIYGCACVVPDQPICTTPARIAVPLKYILPEEPTDLFKFYIGYQTGGIK
jgi:hypothetical protein